MKHKRLSNENIHPDHRKWFVLGTVMLGLFMAVLDGNIVNVALPHMVTAFSTNTDRIRWVVESYAMAYAIFTLTTSWLRERIGIKYVFISGLVLFTISSILCGMSWTVESLIFFRVLQGIGGGIMMPTGFTLITETFPPQQRGMAFGVFGIVIVVAPSVGPTLGGYLVDFVNWRYIFYINVPVGILTFFLATMYLTETKKLKPISFDFWGFVGLSTFLGCLLFALTEGQSEGWKSDLIMSYFAASAAGLIFFLIVSQKAKHPILNIGLFKNFHFTILSLLNFVRSVALFGRMYLLPLFLQNMVGYSARTAGVLLAPGALVSGIVMPITGPLVDKYGPRFFIFSGLFIMGVSTFMYHNIDVMTPYHVILWPILIFGVGSGFLNTPISTSAMNVVKREHIGQVSTVLSVIMQVGGAFGVAILTTLMNDRTALHRAVLNEGISQYSYLTQSAMNGVQSLGQRIGETQYLIELQKLPVLNMIISKEAAIAGFQDAFVYTAMICFLALIPALGILNLKMPHHQKEKSEGGPIGE
jgi:MFS transporter, DHA2 family, multidrug resistance protein